MKKGMKFLAIALAAAMVTTSVPVYAAPAAASSYSSSYSSLKSRWDSFWSRITGNDNKPEEEEQPVQDTDAGSETGTEKPDTTVTTPETDTDNSGSDVELTLVEDDTTVEAGTALRAATYAVNAPSAKAATTLKYFPVTLYNYDDRINNATHQKEVDAALAAGDIKTLTQWNGIYFGGNDHGANVKNSESYTYSTTGGYTYSGTTVNYSDRNNSKYTNGSYYVDVNGTKYVVTKITCSRSWNWYGYTYQWSITYDGGSTTSSDSSITLYTRKASNTSTTGSLEYAKWNRWTGDFNTNGSTSGNRIYSGLVENTLDSQGNIIFTKTEGGIFDANTDVKDVYTKVGLPFKYDSATKYYTFDANEFGAYFNGAPASESTLYYSATPQSHDFNGQDGRKKGWFPFNNATSVTTAASGTADYFFGMKATIPFTMTANGRMKSNDPNSDPIKFDFSGDDDVWVFIDGVLVLDIGGVRNMLNGSIDFAENTWNVTKPSGQNGGDVGDANTPEAVLSGKLFTDESGVGILNQSRETFAAKDSHELTVFYLERGAGSSNCKIQFNLPMKDTLTVSKRANQSIDQSGNVTPLTASEQANVNNIDFEFTLTKDGEKVGNAIYNLINADGQILGTSYTSSEGKFTLKNGQSARFIGEIPSSGATYKVVETIPNNVVETNGETLYTFSKATYNYDGTASNGYTVGQDEYSKSSEIPVTSIDITSGQSIASAEITVKGSDEAEDSLNIICENYFNANLPNPSSRPVDDKIVIDYGLPVVIDVLKNDVYRGDSIAITSVTGAQYGDAEIKDGKIEYQLTKQLTGVEVLTYTATVTGTGNSGGEIIETSESNTAKVYIIPATSMYYEENFGGLVTFTGNWSDEGTAQSDPQEPGVVGTVDDSPYGSDVAYLNDGGDSNGSSKYVSTKDGEAKFSYQFTGTGTSFFARTSSQAAYMRVVVKDEKGNTVSDTRRNNIYKAVDGTDVGTLYNVPVFTYEADNYGTYTVSVTLMKANESINRGDEFYLDGIRVINPLNSTDANKSIAVAAYATDAEANMTVATLREKLLSDAAIEDEVTDGDGNTTTQLKWDGENFVIFTDSNGEIKSAEEYKSNGPKEEVYLNAGQSVTFSLTNWDANSNTIYLGVKAPTGNGSVKINDNTLSINNTADCYYDISKYAQITTDNGIKIATFKVEAGKERLISVTNIKVTGNAEFTIVEGSDVNVSSYENDGLTIQSEEPLLEDKSEQASSNVIVPAVEEIPTEEDAEKEVVLPETEDEDTSKIQESVIEDTSKIQESVIGDTEEDSPADGEQASDETQEDVPEVSNDTAIDG